MSNKTKILNLQGIRGVAFILIFISHCNFFANKYGVNSTTYFGAFGVALFIVLSGFLTVYKNYECSELSPKDQLIKCMKKCYPLHFLTFLMAVPFCIRDLTNIKTWMVSFLNLILVQSWIPKSSVYFSNNAVSWYLSTYLFLMIVSPFVVKYLKQCNTSCIIGLLILNSSIQAVLALLSGNHSWAHWIIYICPITRTLDFVSGGV